MKPCLYCKKPFRPSRPDVKDCSNRCKQARNVGRAPVPWDQDEAQLMLDVIEAFWAMPYGKKTALLELERYAALRQEAIDLRIKRKVEAWSGTVQP